MILAELELENFKQFYGCHTFRPGPDGIVAVIGQNGAGKTTLFEAIEWCLYQPRSIASNEVPTRGRAANARVKLTLEDGDGVRYVIERRLKKRIVSAEIYLEDQPDSRIVEGSRQVTEYVVKRLIGLSHTAFVSTFFTRQKELSFFGTMKETDRRREVAKLLGLQTIRTAQEEINEERKEAERMSLAHRTEYQQAMQGRDFAAELADADNGLQIARDVLASADAHLAGASAAHAGARQALEAVRALSDRDRDIAQRIRLIERDQQSAAVRQQRLTADLGGITAAEQERVQIAAIAAGEAAWLAEVQEHERQSQAHRERQRLELAIAKADSEHVDVERQLHKAVGDANASDLPGWLWRAGDEEDLDAVVRRLIGVARSAGGTAARQRFEILSRARDLAAQRATSTARTAQYRDRLKQREAEIAQQLAEGDPNPLIAELERQRDSAQQQLTTANTHIQSTQREIDKLDDLGRRLTAQATGDLCPSCGRPFTADDLETVLASLANQIATHRTEIDSFQRTAAAAQRELDGLARQLTAQGERRRQLDELRAKFAQGQSMTSDQEREEARLTEEQNTFLHTHALAAVPDETEVAVAQHMAEVRQRVESQLSLLLTLQSSLIQCATEGEASRAALAALGAVAYDAQEHAEANRQLSAAREAGRRLAALDNQINRRGELERDLGAVIAELAELQRDCAAALADREALGFEEQTLFDATAAEAHALTAERAAADLRSQAQLVVARVGSERQTLVDEQGRIAGLERKAEERQRASDLLDRMVKEFNEFDRFVAGQLSPRLSDDTSELVRAITEDKYDRVVFDDNYGIEVYDGPDEKFPLSEFSGGERDVIALCARIALSQMIGDQAVNPPGFLVLDEVFGALDRDRRAQVLETLATLAGNRTVFRQLFVISHVEDVRSSSIFNETWRINERADGISEIENLQESGGLDDL